MVLHGDSVSSELRAQWAPYSRMPGLEKPLLKTQERAIAVRRNKDKETMLSSITAMLAHWHVKAIIASINIRTVVTITI